MHARLPRPATTLTLQLGTIAYVHAVLHRSDSRTPTIRPRVHNPCHHIARLQNAHLDNRPVFDESFGGAVQESTKRLLDTQQRIDHRISHRKTFEIILEC
jgi:hypothetical protein